MSDLYLHLNSRTVPSEDKNDGSRFKVRYDRTIELDKRYRWEVCVDYGSTVWYSWSTVTSVNNTLKYSTDSGSTWTTITIPANSIWSAEGLQAWLEEQVVNNGDYTLDTDGITKIPAFSIKPFYEIGKFVVHIEASGTQVDLQGSTSEFHKLIGWDSQIVTAVGDNTGENVGNITNGIDSIQVVISGLVANSYRNNDRTTGILLDFTPNSPPGSSLNVMANRQRSWLPVSPGSRNIKELEIVLTNQSGTRLIDSYNGLNGDDANIVLHFRIANHQESINLVSQ